MKPVLHVEVVQKIDSSLLETTLHNYVLSGLEAGKTVSPGTTFSNLSNELLADHVESVHICDLPNDNVKELQSIENFELKIHIFKLDDESVQMEGIASGDGDGQEVSAAQHWVLPSRDFHGLWENLVYEQNIKENLCICSEAYSFIKEM